MRNNISNLLPEPFEGVKLPEKQSAPNKLFDVQLDLNATSDFKTGSLLFRSKVGGIIGLFLKTNSFFVMALTPRKDHDGFDFISFDPKEAKPSLYLKLMRTLTSGKGHRVNFTFTQQMNVKSFHVFYNEKSESSLNKYTEQECACSALYNLFFFLSSVHATIHVLYFFMAIGLCTTSPTGPTVGQVV